MIKPEEVSWAECGIVCILGNEGLGIFKKVEAEDLDVEAVGLDVKVAADFLLGCFKTLSSDFFGFFLEGMLNDDEDGGWKRRERRA